MCINAYILQNITTKYVNNHINVTKNIYKQTLIILDQIFPRNIMKRKSTLLHFISINHILCRKIILNKMNGLFGTHYVKPS